MFESFIDRLLARDSFLVVTHIRPDGDAIGSQLALAHFLREAGKHVYVLGSDHTPRNLAWMDPRNQIEVFDRDPSQFIRIGEADAVVVVDANALHRVGPLESTLAEHRGTRFVIDHHPDPQPLFDHMLVDTERSSTGEIVFEMFEHRGLDRLSPAAAEALYVAILTDTGSFRFSTVTPRVHEITARLIEIGSLAPEEIHNNVYKTRSLAGQHLLGLSLGTLQLYFGNKVGIMTISKPMLERTGAHTEEAEGFTDHILAIEGVEVAVLAMQVADHVKLSFRSQGDMPVNRLAASLGGGGHFNASGAFVRGSLDSVIRRLLSGVENLVPSSA
jgi:phosphoesterase RecJ-like protein